MERSIEKSYKRNKQIDSLLYGLPANTADQLLQIRDRLLNVELQFKDGQLTEQQHKDAMTIVNFYLEAIRGGPDDGEGS